ncbi:hypothetical protein JIG36_01175 [Actinoplanes sp. LDG1-06]|uniref:Uncharacterized protein n=1 Tax=Paractinoplanes ovalisporus TaxID=2810368 RepID=A0ABS2A4L0_9ACTN|nr:hypothetical protein [Actinoplanes ovalisporus]MBM2614166.1 hypothetical protein [Actinoplanes ovalisporus]
MASTRSVRPRRCFGLNPTGGAIEPRPSDCRTGPGGSGVRACIHEISPWTATTRTSTAPPATSAAPFMSVTTLVITPTTAATAVPSTGSMLRPLIAPTLSASS